MTRILHVYIVFFSIFGSTFLKGRMSLISGFVTHFWFSMNKGLGDNIIRKTI